MKPSPPVEKSRESVELNTIDDKILLNTASDSGYISFFELDRKYRYTAFSQNYKKVIKKIWGIDIEPGMNALGIIKDPGERNKARQNFDRALNGESFTLVEKYGEIPDCRYYENNYRPLFDDNGTVTGITSFLIDITEKKRLEQDIVKRNQIANHETAMTHRLSTLVGHIPGGIIIETSERKVLMANQQFCELFAIDNPPEALKGMDCVEAAQQVKRLFTDSERFVTRIDEILTAGKTVLNEELTLNDGRVFRRDYVPVEIAKGTIEHMWHYRDITERKKAEEKLKESEEKYHTTFDTTGTATVVIEEDTTLSMVNTQFERLSGYSKQEIEGKKSWTDFVIEDDLEQMKEYHRLRRVDNDSAPSQYEFRFVDRDGNVKHILLNIAVIPNTGKSIASLLDITKIRQVETELEHSKVFLEEVLHTTPAATFTVDTNRRFMSWNRMAEEMTGYQSEEVLGQTCAILLSDTCTEKCRLFDKQYPKPGGYRKCVITGKDGQKIVTLKNFDLLWDSEGKITGGIESFIDISEREQAAEELRETKQMLEEITNGITESIFLISKDYKILWANKAALDQYGYKMGEILHNYCYKVSHERECLCEPPFDTCPIDELQKTGNPVTVEHTHFDRDGEMILVEVSAYPIINENGEMEQFIHVCRDITKRKQTEKALIESEMRFRSISQAATDAIMCTDKKGIIIYWNDAAQRIFGYSETEILGKPLTEIMPRRYRADHDKSLVGFLKTGQQSVIGKTVQTEGLTKDGREVPVEIALSSWEIGNDTYFSAIIRDITKRIMYQKDLEEALVKAQQGEQVKSLFLANMSHEIRTPLNAIIGFTDLIASSTRHLVSDEEKEFFDAVSNSGKRLMHTVHEILDISQIDAGTYHMNPEVFDLVETVRDIVRECSLAAQNKKLKLNFQHRPASVSIRADRAGIEQAVMNIIDNAIKYTDKGGVSVNLKRKSRQAVLTVQDTGIGIAEEYLDDLFEAFTQESEGYTKKFQGIGLGMAITKRHLDLNHVGINIKSAKEKGTTFTLTFIPVDKPKHEEPAEKEKKTRTEKPPILLVEDDANSQKLTGLFVKGLYDISYAVSVKDAKHELKKNTPALILLDLSLLGDEDGLDLARYLRKTRKWRDIPIIALTAHAFSTDRDKCRAAGCNDYLAKPIKRENLLAKISEFI